MKIAYLISAYKDPIHINKLIHALNTKNADFYIYIDKKSKTAFNFPHIKNLHVITNPIIVHWGGFTQVVSTMQLMKEAYDAKKHDYYVLLSGSDYPLRSNKNFIDYLEKNKGKEFIEIAKMPLNDKTFDRVEFPFLEGSNYGIISFLFYKINIMIHILGIKRKYPQQYSDMQLYGGSHWWILSNACVEYILQFVKENPAFSKFYKYTYIPSEMFFHTIIGNSKFMKNVTSALTYTDWNSKKRPLPAEITLEHMPILTLEYDKLPKGQTVKKYFFARKFFDRSTLVTAYIERHMRNKKHE